MNTEVQPGEFLLENCAGGKCFVCGVTIPPGPAIQLSKWTNDIRHCSCPPPNPDTIRRRKRMGNKLNSNLSPKKYTFPLKGTKKRGQDLL